MTINPQSYESGDDKKGLPDPRNKSTRTSFDARREIHTFDDHDPSSKQSLEASVQSGEVFYLDNIHTNTDNNKARYSKHKYIDKYKAIVSEGAAVKQHCSDCAFNDASAEKDKCLLSESRLHTCAKADCRLKPAQPKREREERYNIHNTSETHIQDKNGNPRVAFFVLDSVQATAHDAERSTQNKTTPAAMAVGRARPADAPFGGGRRVTQPCHFQAHGGSGVFDSEKERVAFFICDADCESQVVTPDTLKSICKNNSTCNKRINIQAQTHAKSHSFLSRELHATHAAAAQDLQSARPATCGLHVHAAEIGNPMMATPIIFDRHAEVKTQKADVIVESNTMIGPKSEINVMECWPKNTHTNQEV